MGTVTGIVSNLTIKAATPHHVPFLVETVLGAERSGSQHAGIARVFGSSDDRAAELIAAMFEEEIDGCEFSVSSFLVAEVGGVAAAAVAGWVEGFHDDMPSSMLRSNLIGFTFPVEAMETMRSNGPAVAPIRLDRAKGALQIEYVYVAPAHRGKGLSTALIEAHIARALDLTYPPDLAQVQVFANNTPAINAYQALGFKVTASVRSDDPRTLELLPFNEKLLMEKTLR